MNNPKYIRVVTTNRKRPTSDTEMYELMAESAYPHETRVAYEFNDNGKLLVLQCDGDFEKVYIAGGE